MPHSSEFQDWEDEAGNRVECSAETVLRYLAPLARPCPAAYRRLVAALNAGDLMAWIKAYRQLSDKRGAQISLAHVIAVELLPPPPGAKKMKITTTCPSLSAADLERIRQSAEEERMRDAAG